MPMTRRHAAKAVNPAIHIQGYGECGERDESVRFSPRGAFMSWFGTWLIDSGEQNGPPTYSMAIANSLRVAGYMLIKGSRMTFPEQYQAEALKAIQSINLEKVDHAIRILTEARAQGRHIFVCGHGGDG